jgi:predicted GNAT family acetyltransferase
MTELVIEHIASEQRFVLQVESASAVLEYRLSGSDIDFCHTFVPPEFRGKGLAEKLVRHGLAWAKAEQLNIHASCWYVQKFLR